MRPELRRNLAVGGVLALLLSAATLWIANSGRPRGPAPVRVAAISGTPHYMPVILHSPATATPTPPATSTPVPVVPPTSGDWRTYLAYYRAVAHLPALTENVDWSTGAVAHACYMVQNQELATSEDPSAACYSPHGAAAAPASLLLLEGDANVNDRQVLDQWMQWPFHALSIIDPELISTGFGSYRDQAGLFGTFRLGAVIDVKRGLGTVPPGVTFPIKWPDQNTTVYLTSYDGSEQPDPLTSCGGIPLGMGSGLPIILQLGTGSVTPSVTAHSLTQGATSLAHCVFDETNYYNSIANLQQSGRDLLNARDAVVLIPQAPLVAGKSYAVSITNSGVVYSWSFSVAAAP